MTRLKRVWLIDDDEDDLLLFEEALSLLGDPVDFTYDYDSEQALVKLFDINGVRPDLLFIDWNMPKMSGKDCLKAIRNNPHLSSISIIIYTTSYVDQMEALKSGADFYITKPHTITELIEKLKYVFSKDWTIKH